MKNVIRISILGLFLAAFALHPNYGQNSDKLVYIASPDVKGLERGTNTELFKTILLGKLEEYALNADYQSVAREEALNYIQSEMVVQQSGSVSSESIVKLGEWTGANYILVSNVVGSNGYGTIKLNLYETETGRLTKVKSTSFQEEVQDFSRQVEKVCGDLFGLSRSVPESTTASTPRNNPPRAANAPMNTVNVQGTKIYVNRYDESSRMSWDVAKRACECKGNGWRLPTISELQLIYENREMIGNFSKEYYWAYDYNVSNGEYYNLNFKNGRITGEGDMYEGNKVRCIWSTIKP